MRKLTTLGITTKRRPVKVFKNCIISVIIEVFTQKSEYKKKKLIMGEQAKVLKTVFTNYNVLE